MAKPTFIKRLMMWFFISLAAIGALIALTIALVIPSLPSLESLTEFESWGRMRERHGLSIKASREAWINVIDLMLPPTPSMSLAELA